ncbi:MAG TPA: SH3 domain-containing protein, partial [Phototrophicaceae bacterium]|nr:SH3 domain-containing protein [Phototrophicaceae bacterium]
MTPHPRHLLILLAFILAACGGNPTPQVVSFVPSVTPGAVVPTRQPTATPTPETPTATATFTPAPTATATPATPIAQAVRDIPVRGGPGSDYAVLTTLGPDEQLNIIGISEDGSWYQVRLADG